MLIYFSGNIFFLLFYMKDLSLFEYTVYIFTIHTNKYIQWEFLSSMCLLGDAKRTTIFGFCDLPITPAANQENRFF